MFFDLVRKNSKRNRKENGLFFSSLIISIIAFYIILSLQNQDVIVFLKKMESDAIDKLFLLIPVIYGFSLFILFFLVYFAGKYQLDRRSHELGMYLMLGMRRRKLLFLLLVEEVWNSIFSLLIGIPIAVFLSEVISLVIAKIVGLGVIGHQFSLSLTAIIGTIIGYFIIRLFALMILCGQFSKKQINILLTETQEKKHKKTNNTIMLIKLLSGIVLLVIAYSNAIRGNAWENTLFMGTTLIIGLCGMFLLFHGIGIMFQVILTQHTNKNGLRIFTFRQLQESVFHKPNMLAIASLLIMMALCLFSYGVAVGSVFNSSERHVLDYTFKGNGRTITSELQKKEMDKYIDKLFEMKIGHLNKNYSFSAQSLMDAVKEYKAAEDKDILLNNLQYFDHPYLISLSSYNQLLKIAGKSEIELKKNQAALYNDSEFSYGNTANILKGVLEERPYIEINNEQYELIDGLYQDSIVTDRSITISYGLIVPDELYAGLVSDDAGSSYWNATLKNAYLNNNGLMQAILKVNAILDTTGLEYESYLQNMGRSLFYTVAASYTTIYLAIIFFIVSNTVMGVQFLMQQQKAKKRYQTLISLGANYQKLCMSARQQITWYFSIPIIAASVSALFGTRSLFTGVATTSMRSEVSSLMIVSCAMILFLCVVEFCYMISVKRISDNNIKTIIEIKREDS